MRRYLTQLPLPSTHRFAQQIPYPRSASRIKRLFAKPVAQDDVLDTVLSGRPVPILIFLALLT